MMTGGGSNGGGKDLTSAIRKAERMALDAVMGGGGADGRKDPSLAQMMTQGKILGLNEVKAKCPCCGSELFEIVKDRHELHISNVTEGGCQMRVETIKDRPMIRCLICCKAYLNNDEFRKLIPPKEEERKPDGPPSA